MYAQTTTEQKNNKKNNDQEEGKNNKVGDKIISREEQRNRIEQGKYKVV